MNPGGRPPKNKRPELGERIAKAREQAGLSQYDLARELSVTQQQIVKWEREVASIRSDSLMRLAQVLETSTDSLLGLKPARRPAPKGRLQRVLAEISTLPRRQQDRIIEQIEDSLVGHRLRQKQAS